MHGDDIPTEITKLVYTAPRIYDPTGYEFRPSQNDIAKLLAHFWPAIEQHVREQVAAESREQTAPSPEHSAVYLDDNDTL